MTMQTIFLLIGLPGLAWGQDIQWGAVQPGGFSTELRVPGHVIAREGALGVESARVQGRVTEILKREGEIVDVDELLFTINSPECVSLAQEKDAASSRGLKDLVDAAHRREEQLGLSVEQGVCHIRAAHKGTLTKRQVELGAAFNVGDALATVLDLHRLSVELDVPERSLAQIKVGQSVKVQLASSPEHSLVSRIEHILPTLDPATRSIKARLAPMSLPEGATLDALVFGSVETGVKHQAFKVPTASLVFNKNKQFVIKKTAKDTLPVPVEVIGESENTSTIRSIEPGLLHTGDKVAIKGALFLFRKITES